MKTHRMLTNLTFGTAMGVAALTAAGCAPVADYSASPPVPPVIVQQEVPGVYEEVWEEPMVDVVDVPPGLDPEGTYYRPGHQEVVEIRQGRWQYYNKNKD